MHELRKWIEDLPGVGIPYMVTVGLSVMAAVAVASAGLSVRGGSMLWPAVALVVAACVIIFVGPPMLLPKRTSGGTGSAVAVVVTCVLTLAILGLIFPY